ncbi:hypothetical protein J6TS7_24270 [Paenibacillus dendritiformis]|nr:hypothetical protein J6TS7_24270 [Paenibacillus dendritiformis]
MGAPSPVPWPLAAKLKRIEGQFRQLAVPHLPIRDDGLPDFRIGRKAGCAILAARVISICRTMLM